MHAEARSGRMNLTAAFVYDLRVHFDGKDWHSHEFSPSTSILTRYSDMFERLVVVGRGYKRLPFIPTPATVCSSDRVTFEVVDDLARGLNTFTKGGAVRDAMERILPGVDVVIVRMPGMIGAYAIDVAKELGKPTIVEMVGDVWDSMWNHGSLRGKLWAPVAWANLRRSIASATDVLYVTNEYLQRRYPTKGRSLGCSDVVLRRTVEDLDRRMARIDSKRTFRIGTIGSLDVLFKGLDTLLQAAAILRERHFDFRVSAVGGGDQRRWLAMAEKLGVADLVRFEGYMSHEKISRWMEEIDLYVQPSRQEGLPRSVIEAMSMGCPTAGSSCGGLPELLQRDCIHRPGDHKRLANIIARIIADPSEQKRLATRSLEIARQYLAERLEPKREAFYREVASRALTHGSASAA